MSPEFLIVALIVVLIPGTGVVYTITTGLVCGRRESIAAAFGCTLGILPAIFAAVAGLAAVLHASALVYEVVKFCGVGYLLFLAWQTIKESGPLQISANAPRVSDYYSIARTGCLINVLNPKLSVFFLAFLPQFVDADGAAAVTQMLLLGAVFMAMTFVVFVVYGIFAALIGERIFRSERVLTWMRRSVALVFVGFGLRLALTGR